MPPRTEDRVATALGASFTSIGEIVPPEPASVAPVIAILLAGPLGIALVVAGQRAYRRRQPAADVRQRKNEIRASLGDVAAADGFHDKLARSLHDYIRITLALPSGELSARMLGDAFAARGLSEDLRDEAQALLARCDEGRFAVGGVDAEEKAQLLGQTRRLFDMLDRQVR
jgi:hypothetical protein